MAFHKGDFAQRFTAMGDEAEAKFEEYCVDNGVGYIRFGLSRPPLKMSMLPARVRYTPDYLTSQAFVEVQGLGRDQIFKLKVEKMNCLYWWNGAHPVRLFLWDSAHQRSTLLELADIQQALHHEEASLQQFHDSGPYFAVPAPVLFGES